MTIASPPPSTRDAIRLCLAQLLDDCLHAGFHVTALHIRLAIMELDDFIEDPASRDGEKPKRNVA
ncbi:MAG: hypothetical protein ACOY99_11160 [Pseudomonadota bacterium]